MATASRATREIIRFEPGQPVTLSLKFTEGREVSGQYGAQVMFTTTDDRIFFLDPDVARSVENLQLAKGEQIRILKTRRSRGGYDWDVQRFQIERPRPQVVPPPQPIPAAFASELETQLEASIEKPVMATAQAKLLAALCVAIDAAVEARGYATRKGMPLEFTGEDIRCFANTIVINAERGAR